MKQHATPMPEPDTSLLAPERANILPEGSQDGVRMSSFIDFDEVEETQRNKVGCDSIMEDMKESDSTSVSSITSFGVICGPDRARAP